MFGTLKVALVVTLATFCMCLCPNGTIEQGLSEDDAEFIVRTHNSLRTLVAKGRLIGQPKASNLLRFNYDKKLAKEAQKAVESCVFGTSTVEDTRFSVGQNVYSSYISRVQKGPEWKEVLEKWWDGHKNYVYGSKKNNQYTQMVSAKTYAIGCGYVAFWNEKGWYQKLYLCNYGPAGNIIGRNPYERGSGCEHLCRMPK